jgi:hypothetical protein
VWWDSSIRELLLYSGSFAPPRPLLNCAQTESRPFLDGKLDDPCWQDVKPVVLRNAHAADKGDRADDVAAEFPTEVYLTYDKDYLYLALRCRHPAERYVPPVKVRPRDADLRAFDRVSILLDVDRDYASYYHLQVDQRGCVCEECCQDGCRDRSWNPRWFVACHSEKDVWQIEAAIPFAELTGDPVTLGKAWACNVVRVVPGRGVQAFSLPADVEPRPEGMGLLMFTTDPRRTAQMPPTMARDR